MLTEAGQSCHGYIADSEPETEAEVGAAADHPIQVSKPLLR
jgi:hypothetical protein